MYVRVREGLGCPIPSNFRIISTQPNLWRRMEPIDPRLGEPVTPSAACIAMPRWIIPVKHFFSPKTRGSASGSAKLEWKATSTVAELTPERMNPGFIYSATGGLARDANLDKALKGLMAKLLAKTAPFNSEPFKTFVNNGGKIRVALVDLSTDTKLVFPEIAEFNSSQRTPGASLAKVGLLYAAYQWLFDENVKNEGKGGKFEFTDTFRKALDGVCSNRDASRVSRSLSLAFINSALWHAGLYHCRWGGIWLGAHYNEWDAKGRRWECDQSPYFYKGNCTSEGCHKDPSAGHLIGITALSVATFFTLLAQGRLIDDESSQALKDILLLQPDRCGSRFKEGLKEAGRFAATDRLHSKIGVTRSLSHEGALIDRVSIGKKYVAVVLTVSRSLEAMSDRS